MRSKRAFIGAGLIVVSYPIALAVQFLLGSGAPTVIHFITGAGFIVFATSVFDFGLPRWMSVIGAAGAAAFGTIFILQGVSDVTQLGPLRFVAFDILGHHVERFLPDVVYLWFVALLLLRSTGKSRVLGWAVMLIVVSVEISTLASLMFTFPLPNLRVVVLLPFVWLLFESAERDHASRRCGLAAVRRSGHSREVTIRLGRSDPDDLRFRPRADFWWPVWRCREITRLRSGPSRNQAARSGVRQRRIRG